MRSFHILCFFAVITFNHNGADYTMIIQDNLIMKERSLVPHWFGMDVSSFLGIN